MRPLDKPTPSAADDPFADIRAGREVCRLIVGGAALTLIIAFLVAIS